MKPLRFLTYALVAGIASACSSDIPSVSLGIDDSYVVYRMKKLALSPAVAGDNYRWTLHHADGTDEILSTDRNLVFVAPEEGVYYLTLAIEDSSSAMEFDFTVNAIHEEIEYSPYINRVYEYRPAPGQFVNEMPTYDEGDTNADMVAKVQDCIAGDANQLVSLGSFGGYVTFGFDHTVINRHGAKDFRILGNTFKGTISPSQRGGSAEPGIVMVSFDVNCNGLPDDPWYELAGSEYHNPATIHDYSITYRRPDPNRQISADPTGTLIDIYYIMWNDNRDASGYIAKNTFHRQEYFPKWLTDDELTFSGTRLPENAEYVAAGNYYDFISFPWGYADNHPNTETDLTAFDIDWAVDNFGKPVNLQGIDFVRVYTAVNQYCGWIGETSTEISQAIDLSIAN